MGGLRSGDGIPEAPPVGPPSDDWRRHLDRLRDLRTRLDRAPVPRADPADFRVPEISDAHAVLLYGEDAERHDRRAGRAGAFDEAVAEIRARVAAGAPPRVLLGVTRYNWSRLAALATVAERLLGRYRDFRDPTLNLFPVRHLLRHFLEYAEEVQKRLDPARVSLTLADDQLYELLWTGAERAAEHPDEERQVLRYLGLVSEETFIGPQTIVIDPFHRCNTNCIHCWIHTPGLKHDEEFLDRRIDTEKLYEILDDAAALKTDGIILQGDGEPVLDPRFPEVLRYARERGVKLSFFTNGIGLNERLARLAVELGAHEIYCSLPSGTGENYARVCPMHPPATFDKIVANMRRLIELRNAAGRAFPRLTMTHVLHTLSYDQVRPMMETDLRIGPNVVRYYLVRLDPNNEFLKLTPAEIEVIRRDLEPARLRLGEHGIPLIANIDFQLGHYNPKDGSWAGDFFLRKGCTIGWFFTLIPAKLDASFCCHLRTTGHLDRRRYRDLWFSEDYRRYRRQAKYIRQNMHVRFENGQRLWDEHCTHCDNHQSIIEHHQALDDWGLSRFLDADPGPKVVLDKDRGAGNGSGAAVPAMHDASADIDLAPPVV